jgi:hypothetical protein
MYSVLIDFTRTLAAVANAPVWLALRRQVVETGRMLTQKCFIFAIQ